MIVCKPFSCFVLLGVLCCLHLPATAQLQWLQGMWRHYSITPDTSAGYLLKSSLDIQEVNGNAFTAIQRMYTMPDTSLHLALRCHGIIVNGILTVKAGEEVSRHEAEQVSLWQPFSRYSVRKSYFSISQQQLLLHIEAAHSPAGVVNSFIYYRDLKAYDESTRLMLVKRYGTPQILDDMPVADSMPQNWHGDADSLPAAIATRTNTLVKTLEVTSPDIQVVVLDDAEIDGDIISLYHNNKLVLSRKTLGREMVKYTLTANRQQAHHEFILVAENLGNIPPNTALVRLRAGGVKYEFIVHSDMNENVKFIINYAGQ